MATSKERWIVKLCQPFIFGRTFDGVGRQEVVDTLIIEYGEAGSFCDSAEEILSLWKLIDWDRSEKMLMEEFEACDLSGAMRRAHEEANQRAEKYVEYYRYCEAVGYPPEHLDQLREMRAVRSEEDPK